MTNNFGILVHRTGQSLHLKLMGEFDQRSAREVIETIKSNQWGIGRVFLHTNGLSKIHVSNPRKYLERILDSTNESIKVFFTGEYSPKLAPEGCEQYKGISSFQKRESPPQRRNPSFTGAPESDSELESTNRIESSQ